VDDALYRQFEENGSFLALSIPIIGWLEEAHNEWMENNGLGQLIQWLREYPNPPKGYMWQPDTFHYKGKIVMKKYSSLKQ
jgi:hypothetical protein